MPKMSLYQKFGFMCRNHRENAGLTVVQAVMRMNSLKTKTDDKPICTERSLIRWENGQGLPKIESVKAMAIIYKAPDLLESRIQFIEFLRKGGRAV